MGNDEEQELTRCRKCRILCGRESVAVTVVVLYHWWWSIFHISFKRHNHLFDVNGKYYLSKMYAAELFEHIQQVYSLTTIYVCLMPVEISSIVCAVLTIELLINIWATFHIGSQEMRDRLILLDIFTDIFCVAFPLHIILGFLFKCL